MAEAPRENFSLPALLKSFAGQIAILGDLNQALQLVGGTVSAIVAPMIGAVQAAEAFNQSIMQAQIAYSVATKEIDAFGNEVVSFADRMASSKGAFKKLSEDIEIETRTVVGLTSSRLNNVLNEVVQESSSIIGQFTDKYGSSTTDIFKKLTANLAATFSLVGSPEFQDPQETRALLLGQVNDPNAFTAQKLNISEAEVDAAKAQGKYVDLLIEKTEAYRQASTLASDSLSNVTSNIQETVELASRAFGEPILEAFSSIAGKVFGAITSSQEDAISGLQQSTGNAVLAIDKDIIRNQEKLKVASTDTEKSSIAQYINNLGKQREDVIGQATKKFTELGVEDAASVANRFTDKNTSIEGREAMLSAAERASVTDSTAIDAMTAYAAEFGTQLADIFTNVSIGLNKLGEIFQNFNIDDLLVGISSGALDGFMGALNFVAEAINRVLSVIDSFTSGLEGLIGPFVSIDSGQIIGVVIGAIAALKLLTTTSGAVSKGFSFLLKETMLLARAMSVTSGNRAVEGVGFLGRTRAMVAEGDIAGRAAGVGFDSRLARRGAFANAGAIMVAGDIASRIPTATAGAGGAGILARTVLVFQTIMTTLTSLLPLLLAAVAIVAGAMVVIRGVNVILSKLAGESGLLGKFASSLQKAISVLDVFGKIKLNREEVAEIGKRRISNVADSPGNKLKSVGGVEGYNRSANSTDVEASNVRKEFIDSYNELGLLLDGDKKALKASGKDDAEIDTILSARKDAEFVKETENRRDDLAKQYKELTGQEITNTQQAISQTQATSLTGGAFTGLDKVDNFTDPNKTATLGKDTFATEVENIGKNFDSLLSNDVLGTESLGEYADKFLEASGNELLLAEQRNAFLAMYNKAIEKEMEIANRFISATEKSLDARISAGELGAGDTDLEKAKLEVQKLQVSLLGENKKGIATSNKLRGVERDGVKAINSMGEESKNAAREVYKLYNERDNILKSTPQVKSTKNKEEVDTLNKELTDKLFDSYTPNGQMFQDSVQKYTGDLNQVGGIFKEISKESTNKSGLKSYLGGFNELVSGELTKKLDGLDNEGVISELNNRDIYDEVIKNNADLFKSTSAFGRVVGDDVKNLAKSFFDTGNIDAEKFNKLDQGGRKDVSGLLRDAISEVQKSGKIQLNVSPYFDETAMRAVDGRISGISKKINELSGKIIIELEDGVTSDKLKKLQSERDKLKGTLEYGKAEVGDFSKAKVLDREIAQEKATLTLAKLQDKGKTLDTKLTASDGDQKKIEAIAGEITVNNTFIKVMKDRISLMREGVAIEKKLAEIQIKKETATPEELKKLESEETKNKTKLQEIDSQTGEEQLSELEQVRERIAGAKELLNLSAEELKATSDKLLAAQKLYDIEKNISAEKNKQVLIANSILDAQINTAKAQRAATGSFSPELFQSDIAKASFNEVIESAKDAENNLAIANKNVESAYSNIGGGDIKNLFNQITADEPLISEEVFIKSINENAKASFKNFGDAFKFAQDSVNTGINLDKIINADSITQEVQDAYKDIFSQDIALDTNLNSLQTVLKNTKGAIVTGNKEAKDIGTLAGNLESGDISYDKAIEGAKELGINIEGVKNKSQLLLTLTSQYGKSLGSEEIVNSLKAQKEAIEGNIQSQIRQLDGIKKIIDANRAEQKEARDRVARQFEAQDLIANASGLLSDTDFGVSSAVRNFQEATADFNTSDVQSQIEEFKKIAADNNIAIDTESLTRLENFPGISNEAITSIRNMASAMKQLEDAVKNKLDGMFAKRQEAQNVINALGTVNIGPNAGLSNEQRNLVTTTGQLDDSITNLKASASLQQIISGFSGVQTETIEWTDLLGEVGNVAQALEMQIQAISANTVSEIENINSGYTRQLKVLQSLYSAYNSLAQASDVYAGVANKIANKEISKIQNDAAKVDAEKESKLNALVAKTNKQFGGPTLGQERQIRKLREDSGVSAREETEARIQKLKDLQVKLEQTQSEIALKRLQIENKISQLKAVQERGRLYAERAQALAMPKGAARDIALKNNSTALQSNSSESSLLRQAGKTLDSASRLNQASTGGESALREAQNQAERDSAALDKLFEQLNDVKPPSDADYQKLLDEQVKQQEEAMKSVMDTVSADVLAQLSEQAKTNMDAQAVAILNSFDAVIKGNNIAANLNSISTNVAKIASGSGKPGNQPGNQPGPKPQPPQPGNQPGNQPGPRPQPPQPGNKSGNKSNASSKPEASIMFNGSEYVLGTERFTNADGQQDVRITNMKEFGDVLPTGLTREETSVLYNEGKARRDQQEQKQKQIDEGRKAQLKKLGEENPQATGAELANMLGKREIAPIAPPSEKEASLIQKNKDFVDKVLGNEINPLTGLDRKETDRRREEGKSQQEDIKKQELGKRERLRELTNKFPQDTSVELRNRLNAEQKLPSVKPTEAPITNLDTLRKKVDAQKLESEFNNKSSDSSSRANPNLRDRNTESNPQRRPETLVPLTPLQAKPQTVNNITNNNITNNSVSNTKSEGVAKSPSVSVEVKGNNNMEGISQIVSELRGLRGDISRPTSNNSPSVINSGSNSTTVNVVQQTTPSLIMDANTRASKSENITMSNMSNRIG